MKKPAYFTEAIRQALLKPGICLSKPLARTLGTTYKKLIRCFEYAGLPTEADRKLKHRKTIEYCKQRLASDPSVTVRMLAHELGRHEVSLAKLLRNLGLRDYTRKLNDFQKKKV